MDFDDSSRRSKFLDPKNDIAFKRIFGTEKNKDILIHFLNDILGFNGKSAIQDIEFLSTIRDADIACKKQSIVDVLCRDSTGVQYICEMLVAKTEGFEKRAQYYAAKAYSREADKGDNYHDLKEIIFIAIADYISFPDKSEYKSKHTIRDEDTNEHNLKDFYFIFIELPKFPKTKEDQLSSIVEKWIYFFKYADETSEEELEKIIGSDSIIKRAYEELNKFNWSEKEFIAYEQEIKRILDEKAVLAQKLDDATQRGRQEGREEGIQEGREEGIQKGRQEGIQEGIEKGRQEGIQEGIEKGIQKGRQEGIEKVAKNLLQAGISTDDIHQLTGLSPAVISKL